MKKFEYKVDAYIKVWQRTDLYVNAETKEKADALVKSLVNEFPISLDNGNNNIETGNVEYLCDTESLIDSTTKTSTIEVYCADCESLETQHALYTNLKEESPHTINDDFRTVIDMRENYTSTIHNILSRILKQENKPIVLANEEDDVDDEIDVIVACSGKSHAYNGRVLSVWLNQDTICMKVENIDCPDVIDIKESDLEDEGLYFIINRILTPVNENKVNPNT